MSEFPEFENMNISKEYFSFIKEIYNDYTKYIKQYKVVSSDYMKKLEQLQEKYSIPICDINKNYKKKYSNINTNVIFSITSMIPRIIKQLIDNTELFVNGIDTTIKLLENTVKEKTNIASNYLTKYEESKNNLVKNYKNIDKYKDLYMNSMSNVEDLIYKFYNNNKNNQEDKNKKDKKEKKDKIKNAFDSSIITKDQVSSAVLNSKKLEKQYKGSFEVIELNEKTFNKIAEESTEQMKKLSLELTIKLKDIILDFIVLLKNSFKMPLSEIDTILPKISNFEDNSKYQKFINESYKQNKKLTIAQPQKYKLKCCHEPPTINGKYNINNHIVVTEDGFGELTFIDDTPTFLTIKMISKHFELIDNANIDLKIEGEKVKCKELTLKLLSFTQRPISDNNNVVLSEEEIDQLNDLLDKHHNRVLFLQTLSTFRAKGIFDFPIDIFDLMNEFFNIIINTIVRDKDFHSAKNIIILSQTYYYLDNMKKKIYLQERIKKESLFRSPKFWKDYLEYSIEKEIVKSVKSESINGTLIKENQKESDDMYANMVFAQLVPIADNMIEFGISRKEIKEIIKPIIKHYNMSEQSITIIDDVIHKDSERKSILLNEEIKQLDLKLLYKNRKNFDSCTKLNELIAGSFKNEDEHKDLNNEIYEDIDNNEYPIMNPINDGNEDNLLHDNESRQSEYFINKNSINEGKGNQNQNNNI